MAVESRRQLNRLFLSSLAVAAAMFKGIARDEQRHAALSHAIQAWGVRKLPAWRATIEARYQSACERLQQASPETASARELGAPPHALALAAFEVVSTALAA